MPKDRDGCGVDLREAVSVNRRVVLGRHVYTTVGIRAVFLERAVCLLTFGVNHIFDPDGEAMQWTSCLLGHLVQRLRLLDNKLGVQVCPSLDSIIAGSDTTKQGLSIVLDRQSVGLNPFQGLAGCEEVKAAVHFTVLAIPILRKPQETVKEAHW